MVRITRSKVVSLSGSKQGVSFWGLSKPPKSSQCKVVLCWTDQGCSFEFNQNLFGETKLLSCQKFFFLFPKTQKTKVKKLLCRHQKSCTCEFLFFWVSDLVWFCLPWGWSVFFPGKFLAGIFWDFRANPDGCLTWKTWVRWGVLTQRWVINNRLILVWRVVNSS